MQHKYRVYGALDDAWDEHYVLMIEKEGYYPWQESKKSSSDYHLAIVLEVTLEAFRQKMDEIGAYFVTHPEDETSYKFVFETKEKLQDALDYAESLIMMMVLDNEQRQWIVEMGGIHEDGISESILC
jgi:hypothetical protein